MCVVQDHEEALEETERRMAEVQKEREKEAELNRRQANDLKYLTEREERSRREKEVRRRRMRRRWGLTVSENRASLAALMQHKQR